jgi:hypothetical protein
MTLLATPVDLPKVVPDDWDKWWHIWNTYAQPLKKKTPTPNGMQGGQWVGFDVYRNSLFKANYEAAEHDLSLSYPSLFNAIMGPLQPGVTGLRFVESRCAFPAHVDNFMPAWQLRCMFSCPNPSEQWYYTRLDGTDERPLVLAEETNWFAYKDGALKHGTRYDPTKPKILLQVFCLPKPLSDLVQTSELRFHTKCKVIYE